MHGCARAVDPYWSQNLQKLPFLDHGDASGRATATALDGRGRVGAHDRPAIPVVDYDALDEGGAAISGQQH